MLIVILLLNGVIVCDFANITTFITGSITIVVKAVSLAGGFIDCSANGTLHPVTCSIFILCTVIVIGNLANITTFITGSITSIVKAVSLAGGFINSTADRTLHPVTRSILVLYAVIVSDGTNVSTLITGGVTSIVKVVTFSAVFVDSTADRTLHPVGISVLILHRVIVGDSANISAFIAGGVTSVVKAVSLASVFIDCSANGTLHPVLIVILLLNGVIVSDSTNVTTFITGSITSIVVAVRLASVFIDCSADRTLHPVGISVLILHRVIVGDSANISAFIAGGVTSVVKAVSLAGGFINGAADGTFHPMLVVILVLNGIIVGDGTNVATLITSGVTSIVKVVSFSAVFIDSATDGTFQPVFGAALF